MSDEMVTGTNNGGATISDKLSDAARALHDADAGARARREHQDRLDAEREREDQLLLEAAQKERENEEREREALIKKKKAELEYAEGYRRKLREERARAEAADRSRRGEEARRQRREQLTEEAERQRREAEAAHLEEAERRNSESDSLLELTAMRIREREDIRREQNERIAEAEARREQMQRDAAEAQLAAAAAEDGQSNAAESAIGVQNEAEEYIISIADEPDGSGTPAREEREGADNTKGYRFASSTLGILNTDGDFDGWAQRRRSAESSAEKYRSTGGRIVGARVQKSGAYRYESATSASEPTAKNASEAEDQPFEELIESNGTADTSPIVMSGGEGSTRVNDLIAEKYRLEEKLHETEIRSRAELAELADKEHEAERRLLEAEYSERERQYLEQIEDLNARLKEAEREHDVRRGELEGSILRYESQYKEINDAQESAAIAAQQEALEAEAARAVNDTEIAVLNGNALSRVLNKRDAEERRILGKISKAGNAVQAAAREGKDQTAALYEKLRLEGTLLSSYIISYKYTLAAAHKSYSRSYRGKLTSFIKQYNTDLGVWERLVGIECGEIPASIADDIKEGREIAALPNVYMPEKIALAANAKDSGSDGLPEAAELISTEESVRSLTEKELTAFLEKQSKREREYSGKLTRLERAQGGRRGDELAQHLYEYVPLTGKLLSCYIADYRAIIASGGARYKRTYKRHIDTLIPKHNRALETWRALTESSVTLMPTNLTSLIEEGGEIPEPMTELLRPARSGTAQSAAGNDERGELTEQTRRDEQRDEVVQMNERELAAYLNRRDAKERALIRTAQDKRRESERATDSRRLVALKACIDAEAELVEMTVHTYRTVLAVRSRYKRQYASKLNSYAKQYNADLEVWRTLADTSASPLPTDLAKRTEEGTAPETVDTVRLPDADMMPSEDKKRAPTAREENAEHARIYAEEAERERQARAMQKPTAAGRGKRETVIKKRHMDYDIATLEEKIRYRSGRYSRHIEESALRYGETERREARLLREEEGKLAAINRGARGAVRYARGRNGKYLEAVSFDPATVKTDSSAKLERIADLQKRLEELLLERDDLNIRLCSLYREEKATGKRPIRRSYRASLAAARLAEARRTYRRCGGTYRTVSRFKVSLQEKQKIYDAMNKKIELAAYLTECRYRLSHERPRGAARRKLNTEIRETQKRMRDMDADIRFYTDKYGKRSARKPVAEHQILWLVVLLLIAGAGFAIYWWREPIWQLVQTWLAGILPGGN